ncbi:transporter [bacterium]|nr:transporter [bacterium]
MNRKLFSSMIIAIFIMGSTAQAQLIWRGAGMLKQGQAILQASNYLTDFNCSYDWAGEKWQDYPEDKIYNWNGSNTMFAVGVTNRLELMMHVPIDFKSKEHSGVESSARGIGDMYVKARYAIIPWAKDKYGFTVVAATRFATGDKDADIAMGDGTTDLGLGGIFMTRWHKGWRGHLRAAFWLNGKTDADINVGDELKMVAKMDRKFSPKFIGFITYINYQVFKKQNADGDAIDCTHKSRHYLSPGFIWKPVKGLNIRPKVLIPFGGEGGSLFSVKPLLDFWYTFKLFG